MAAAAAVLVAGGEGRHDVYGHGEASNEVPRVEIGEHCAVASGRGQRVTDGRLPAAAANTGRLHLDDFGAEAAQQPAGEFGSAAVGEFDDADASQRRRLVLDSSQ